MILEASTWQQNFLENQFALSKFYCGGVSLEKQCFGTIFLSARPSPPPWRTQILFLIRVFVSAFSACSTFSLFGISSDPCFFFSGMRGTFHIFPVSGSNRWFRKSDRPALLWPALGDWECKMDSMSVHSCTRVWGPLSRYTCRSRKSWCYSGVAAVSRYTPPKRPYRTCHPSTARGVARQAASEGVALQGGSSYTCGCRTTQRI